MKMLFPPQPQQGCNWHTKKIKDQIVFQRNSGDEDFKMPLEVLRHKTQQESGASSPLLVLDCFVFHNGIVIPKGCSVLEALSLSPMGLSVSCPPE